MSYEAFLFCKMALKSDKARDAGLTIPDEITYIRDLSYGENAKYHTLDICFPKERASEKLPVIISFHGGGYVYGSTKIYQFYCADLARRGFAVVNFNYRLAPKYKYPAPLQDMELVMDYLVKEQEKYPIDLTKVFLVGDSAGAQLVSQYATICTNEAYGKLMGIKKPAVKILALGLNCGMYDLKKRVGSKAKGIVRDYLGRHPEQFAEELDVLRYITSDYPPVYLFSANGDFLKEECAPMAQFLQDRGVPCEYKIYGDENTGHVFHVNVRDAIGVSANDDEIAFFRKYL